LEPYKPAAIGLDIFRDRAVSLEQSDLKARLQKIIAICSIQDIEKNSPPVSPPPEIDIQQIGFANTARDPDNIIRRHTIGMDSSIDSSNVCETNISFSFQLASRYLERVLALTKFPDKNNPLYIGNKVFPDIKKNRGAYNQPILGGYEVMLNYRASSQIAEQVQLSDILNGSKDERLADLTKNRIILIGTTARSYNDYRFTPYGEKPGLEIQAHMVSQILSAVLSNRPLIWTFPQWADVIWIYLWSFVGGISVLHLRPKLYLLLLTSGVLTSLCIFCYILLLSGLWMPLIPPFIAFSSTGLGIIAVKSLVKAKYR
jgi:CHASE2 domain-containing sensor protein